MQVGSIKFKTSKATCQSQELIGAEVEKSTAWARVPPRGAGMVFLFLYFIPLICIFLSSVFLSLPPYKLTMTILPLSYEVAHCSSWDEDRSPEQLVNSSPGNRSSDTPILNPEEELRNVKVKGWQTPK
jgi:hypothetical protein